MWTEMRRRTTNSPRESPCQGRVATRTLTVLWSKRNEGPQRTRRDAIRMARSVDGGRTFAPAAFTHDSALSGARGWESLIAEPGGRVHARVASMAVTQNGQIAEAAAHSGMAHKGQPPQDVYHGTITADGRVVESVIATGVCSLLQDRCRG